MFLLSPYIMTANKITLIPNNNRNQITESREAKMNKRPLHVRSRFFIFNQCCLLGWTLVILFERVYFGGFSGKYTHALIGIRKALDQLLQMSIEL